MMTGLDDPYNQGWLAYSEGYPHNVSKFIESDDKREQWIQGWVDASEYHLRWAANQKYVDG